MIERLCIIGVGLIGGSLALALKQAGQVREVVGVGRDRANLDLALQLGVVDSASQDICEGVSGADMVVLAVPVGSTAAVCRQLVGCLDAAAVLTDVGSVKADVVAQVTQAFGYLPANFVPGHPIAGTEKSGAGAAFASLYVQRRVLLTPLPQTAPAALDKVTAMWQASGAEVEIMDTEHHDRVLAATSHLPHMLAFGLVDSLAQQDKSAEIFRYAAGGFRDFTRIASSDPTMWKDICLHNRKALLEALEAYEKDLKCIHNAIERGDGELLQRVFSRAKSARDQLVQGKFMTQSTTFVVSPALTVGGRLRVPGDKSISHRSIMLGSLAEGVTEVSGFLDGEDCLATMQAFQAMGVNIERLSATSLRIHGVGLHGLRAPAAPLYLGNSGTSMRLMSGLLSGQAFATELIGDASLSGRPMRRVTDPLARMGARIATTDKGTPPLNVSPVGRLQGIDYTMPVASAQVKSCLLLAGLFADGETCVTEPAPTRDHTERMLRGFGYAVRSEGERICLQGGGRLTATNVDVPADISSAAFFLVAGSIAVDSELWLEHVGVNPTRTGVIDILRLMGADITLHNGREVGGEPVADLCVRSAALHGIDIPEALVPLAIDEFPAIFIAAASASGSTRLSGAEELRVKESDRIQVMADGLAACGVVHQVLPDGIVIEGCGRFRGGEIHSHGDHRIAMAFAVASLRASSPIHIFDCDNVNTSFPGFASLANQAGLNIEVGPA